MAEGLAVIFITVLTYSGLLLYQKRRSGTPWKRLLKKGDPWFFLNLPVALICGLAFGSHLAGWLSLA